MYIKLFVNKSSIELNNVNKLDCDGYGYNDGDLVKVCKTSLCNKPNIATSPSIEFTTTKQLESLSSTKFAALKPLIYCYHGFAIDYDIKICDSNCYVIAI